MRRGNNPQLICELLVDGEVRLISDASWQCGLTRITYNSLRFGETFDASIEEPTEFHEARISRGAGGALILQRMPPIRLKEVLDPVKILSVPDGSLTYDFGVNLSGNAEIRVKGRRGGKVHIIYAEVLNGDNSLNRTGIRGSTQRADRFQEDPFRRRRRSMAQRIRLQRLPLCAGFRRKCRNYLHSGALLPYRPA